MESAGAPPEAEKIRAMVEERLAQAEREDGEKLTIEWRGVPIHLRVISMPPALLYYNPDTHRIRAQRAADPGRDAVLESAPWSPDGQAYLDYLLRAQPSDPTRIDPDFEVLREDLENFSQTQPGLITPDGILVNGNTRCAALRELGARHIRVAVLPTDVTQGDISAVELTLQLRRENKRDYSYINQLLAVDEQMKAGRRQEDIAREFHVQPKTLQQGMWILGLVRNAISRSREVDGTGLQLVDFEDHQEKLKELHRAYVKEAASDPDSAESLKESRLALIMLGFSKTDVRNARSDFFSKYLEPKLPLSLASEVPNAPSTVSIPGLNLVVAGDSARVQKQRAITELILKARAADSQPSNGTKDAAPKQAAEQLLNEARESVDGALKLAGRDDRLRQRKLAAPERISDATDSLLIAISDVAESMATNSVDGEAIEEAAVGLRDALERLARQLSRAIEVRGEATGWLLAAAQLETDRDED